jgi:type 1 glutamine amidotransferase
MRTLIICDDYWHPASTIRQGMGKLEGFTFDWIENGNDWSAEHMAEYPLVLFAKSNNVSQAVKNSWVTEEVQQAFVDYVRQGNGLLVVHSGTVYAKYPILRSLLGGAFTHHPDGCPVTIEPQAGHPLTTGSITFTAQDEHYFIELDDTQADVFMTTTSVNGTQPGGWTRSEGKGRVCILTPGHTVEVWQHPSFQTLLRNALRWCSGKV